MSLLTLQNPAALDLAPVIDLFDRTFAKKEHADPDETRKWLAQRLPADGLA